MPLADHSGSHTAGWLVAIFAVLLILSVISTVARRELLSNWTIPAIFLNIVLAYGLLRAAVWARTLTAFSSTVLIVATLGIAYKLEDSSLLWVAFASVGFGLCFLLLVIGQPGRLRWWIAMACLILPILIPLALPRHLRKPAAVEASAANEAPEREAATEPDTEFKPSLPPDVERPMAIGWLIGKWENAANVKDTIVFDETGGCTMGTAHGTYRAFSKTIVTDMKDKEHLAVSLTFSPSEDRNSLKVVGSVSGLNYQRSH